MIGESKGGVGTEDSDSRSEWGFVLTVDVTVLQHQLHSKTYYDT